MRRFFRRLHRGETGSVTAEYAMITVAAVSFGVLLISVIKMPAMRAALSNIILSALHVSG
jgi:Flp pilus assembly pilin Flp